MSAKPRVLMVSKYYPPHLGGIESHVHDLSVGLASTGAAEVTVLVVGDGPRRVDEQLDGVRVVRVPRAFEYASTPVSWSFAREFSRLARTHDVIHFHFPYPFGEVCSLLSTARTPRVVTYHTDIVRQKLLLALYRPLLNRFLDRADVIVASSPNMIQHSDFLRSRSENSVHIDFGLPLERFLESPEKTARARELTAQFEDAPVVLFVGRLVYYKGLNVLLDAFARLDSREARLVAIGTGPLESTLREQATRLGIADRVSFIPPCDDDELAAWYSAADVFCLPSVERSEAFGLVQVEAHASGTPVVSTDLPTGVPYANLHGETGLVVPPGDARLLAEALDRLIADDALRVRLGEQARERAYRTFGLERMCASVADLYMRVMGERGREVTS